MLVGFCLTKVSVELMNAVMRKELDWCCVGASLVWDGSHLHGAAGIRDSGLGFVVVPTSTQ